MASKLPPEVIRLLESHAPQDLVDIEREEQMKLQATRMIFSGLIALIMVSLFFCIFVRARFVAAYKKYARNQLVMPPELSPKSVASKS